MLRLIIPRIYQSGTHVGVCTLYTWRINSLSQYMLLCLPWKRESGGGPETAKTSLESCQLYTTLSSFTKGWWEPSPCTMNRVEDGGEVVLLAGPDLLSGVLFCGENLAMLAILSPDSLAR